MVRGGDALTTKWRVMYLDYDRQTWTSTVTPFNKTFTLNLQKQITKTSKQATLYIPAKLSRLTSHHTVCS